ncbi:hypothetical protein I4U23_019286 [Adineta vaga]|nr:hypothetical protein I4U23_019286 [Adineta vaga]
MVLCLFLLSVITNREWRNNLTIDLHRIIASMCHFILLSLLYSHHQFIILSFISFCDSYRRYFQLINCVDGTFYITNHTEKITSELKANDEIIIFGVLIEHIIYIDLLEDKNNIPFHVRFANNIVIFNNKKKGIWLNEIKSPYSPLVNNATFVILILVNAHDKYNVTYNNLTLFNIEKRESLRNVNQFHIYGNFTLKSVKVIHISKEEDNSTKITIIIGIAITSVLIIITGLGICCILRRHKAHSKSEHRSNNDQDSIMESVGSFRSDRTSRSNVRHTQQSMHFPFTEG